jgi:hypothetical protein
MRKIFCFCLLLLLITPALFSCVKRKGRLAQPPPLSIQQRAAMQTEELEGSFDIGFSATISVLQDEGWQIEVVDKASGIIQASSLKRQDMIGPHEDWYAENDPSYRETILEEASDKGYEVAGWTRWEQITSHIEHWGKERVRQRITITKFGSLPPNTFSYSEKKDNQKIITLGGKEQSMIVEKPAIYQYLFQQIQRAIFIRQGLDDYR